MADTKQAAKGNGFLTRLRRDQRGNTIAMFAAAVFPIIGLVGGGLDMSRIYLVKTRLQAACDAGALAGRKQMGVGLWTANSGKAYTEAKRMFNLNFGAGAYGSTSGEPIYTETSGTVNGHGTATIPMTLMRVFGKQTTRIDVYCHAAQSIPNTDIMFVLDTTGSMASAPNGATVTTSNPSKIDGLRKVTKCFYEALAKVNISSVTPADCSETSDPSGGNASGSQIRFGFVPYSSNVNVGKLLPQAYLANSFTYQTRQAVLTPVWAYTLGAEGTHTYGAYSNPATPTSPNSSYVSYTPSGTTSATQNINGTNYQTVLNVTSTACPGSTTPAAYTVTATNPTETLNSTSSTAPVYPATTNPYGNYTRTLTQTRYFFRYLYDTSGSNKRCRLQYATSTGTFDKTASGTSTKPVTWTYYADTFTNWDYKAASLNVSGIKNGTTGYNTTVAIPNLSSTNQSLLVSGSTTSTTYKRLANLNVTWDGCIEERQTKRTNSWSPYPSDSPDLDLKSAPTSDDSTKWKPSFNGATWARYSGSTKVYTTQTSSSTLATNVGYYCPTAARLLTEYNGTAGATSFANYVDSLTPSGSTYHDIGMIWGARLLLPDGIFATNNAIGSVNGIDRNIIFMTDGDTDSGENAATAYGLAPWDRRQEVDQSVAPDETAIDTKVNARFPAVCNQLKDNENVTIWVVSFGGTGISATTKARLKACATDDSHYFDAADTATLLTSFKAIANAISQLRLTS